MGLLCLLWLLSIVKGSSFAYQGNIVNSVSAVSSLYLLTPPKEVRDTQSIHACLKSESWSHYDVPALPSGTTDPLEVNHVNAPKSIIPRASSAVLCKMCVVTTLPEFSSPTVTRCRRSVLCPAVYSIPKMNNLVGAPFQQMSSALLKERRGKWCSPSVVSCAVLRLELSQGGLWSSSSGRIRVLPAKTSSHFGADGVSQVIARRGCHWQCVASRCHAGTLALLIQGISTQFSLCSPPNISVIWNYFAFFFSIFSWLKSVWHLPIQPFLMTEKNLVDVWLHINTITSHFGIEENESWHT